MSTAPSFADVLRRVLPVAADRTAVVDPWRRVAWPALFEEAAGLGGTLAAHGLAVRTERPDLQPWESGQAHLGLLLGNRVEHVEAILGAWLARAAPCNLNHHYTAAELAPLVRTAAIDALVYEVELAPLVAELVAELDGRPADPADPADPGASGASGGPGSSGAPRLLIEVGGGPRPAVAGAIPWAEAVAGPSAAAPAPAVPPTPDDLHLLCTGGTTGLPKVVLWRQADLLVRVAPPNLVIDGGVDLDRMVERARKAGPIGMPAGPLMHAAAQWVALGLLLQGGTVVLTGRIAGFDAAEDLRLMAAEGVQLLSIVGDAHAQPLLRALDAGVPAPATLRTITTGGMAMSPVTKARLQERLPEVRIVDVLGSSETGLVGDHRHGGGAGGFGPRHGTVVLDGDRRRTLRPGEDEDGWLAVAGPCPLGYLGDPDRTAATFPTIDGVRHAISGDRARVEADGSVAVLGRDATTINTGGEKVFAEEVEAVLRTSPLVADVAVVGRPSERWGAEVVAIVAPVDDAPVDLALLQQLCDGQLGRFKWPRHLVVVDAVRRLANGKLDRPWAVATAAAPGGG